MNPGSRAKLATGQGMKEINQVAVIALDKRYKKLEKDLMDKARKVLLFLEQAGSGPFGGLKAGKLAPGGVGLEIYLVGSARMRKLNRQHRGKDEATNVLAFESSADFPQVAPRFLGEIYLSPSYIRKCGEDIQLMLAHGMLHLSGFNHETESDRITMEKVEEAVAAFIRERSERK